MIKNYRVILIVLVIVGLLMLWASRINQVMILELIDDRTGKVYGQIEVNIGEYFEYGSIHSVSMTPLREFIRIEKDDTFVSNKVMYTDQSGAGLPEFAYDDATYYTEGEWMVIEGYERSFKKLSFQIDKAYNNYLQINGTKIALYDYFQQGKGSLCLKLKNYNRTYYKIKLLMEE